MAEVLKLALLDGKSARTIAKALGMSRRTVRRLLGKGPPKAAPTYVPRETMLTPYEGAMRQLLADARDVKAPAVLERLRPLGYTGGLTIVRRWLRQHRPRPKEAYLTLSFEPGAAVQVDWADFGFALPGCPRRVSAFVMALCHSRYLYLEFCLSQSMASFLRRMENAVRFFGGTTHVDIFDNMKTVVLAHTPHGTRFNPTFLEYARTRGFAAKACNVAKGNEKGRVERPIGFVRERFWPGRRFRDLMDLNAQAMRWRDDFANNRVHEATGKVPALVFENEERPHLKALSGVAFNTDETEGVGVTKTFRVRFDRNLYSVPPRLVSQQVLVRATEEEVRVFLGPKEVAVHRRRWGVGEDIEAVPHREQALALKPGATPAVLPSSLTSLGEVGRRYFQVLHASPKSLRKETERLVFLAEVFGDGPVGEAVADVMRTGHVGAEYVEYVLRHQKGLSPSAPPLKLGRPELDELHLPSPDLSAYDALFPPPKTLNPGEPPPGKGGTS
jgi:transposase